MAVVLSMLIVVASGISAVGLLTDSSVDILASFFISPLMSMILAATWGAVIQDRSLFLRSCRNTLFGASICWISGALIGLGLVAYNDPENLAGDIADNSGNSSLFYAISINAVQITSRGPPAFVNLMSTIIIAAPRSLRSRQLRRLANSTSWGGEAPMTSSPTSAPAE